MHQTAASDTHLLIGLRVLHKLINRRGLLSRLFQLHAGLF